MMGTFAHLTTQMLEKSPELNRVLNSRSSKPMTNKTQVQQVAQAQPAFKAQIVAHRAPRQKSQHHNFPNFSLILPSFET